MTAKTPYLFYALDGRLPQPGDHKLTGAYELSCWHPSLTSIRPRGFSLLQFGVWWLFHHVRMFTNRDYSLIAIYAGERLVHRTCIFPRYFRFPFMEADDLQIGDVWTAPTERGNGLAGVALRTAMSNSSCNGRRLWYVVHQDNTASIRLAEKCGFHLCGRGSRLPRFGIATLGSYRIDQIVNHDHCLANPAAA